MAAALTNKLHLITWSNVFVLVDYGQARASDYVTLGALVLGAAAEHPAGIGGIVIIPPSATPPSDTARAAMNDVMRKLGTSLRCFCWVVEGGGFQGAMVRAVLTGLRMIGRLPYETYVSSNIEEALGWTLLRLGDDGGRPGRVEDAVQSIKEGRLRSERERPPHL
jgi:hypothetical protein